MGTASQMNDGLADKAGSTCNQDALCGHFCVTDLAQDSQGKKPVL
jgi:hypothetical protein